MKEELYKENIKLTEEAIENLKKMPKDKQMYIYGIIKGMILSQENEPKINIA